MAEYASFEKANSSGQVFRDQSLREDEIELEMDSHNIHPNVIPHPPPIQQRFFNQQPSYPNSEGSEDGYGYGYGHGHSHRSRYQHGHDEDDEDDEDDDRTQTSSHRDRLEGNDPSFKPLEYPPPILQNELSTTNSYTSASNFYSKPDQTDFRHKPSPPPPSQPPKPRPPVWMRMIWDRTDLDQKIHNHARGIGVQARSYVCYLLSLGMLIALIIELVTNSNYQGSPISTKPTFNYMIGPSAYVLINTGARFTPCIKLVPEVSNTPFPCLNSTSSTSTCTSSLEDICGFGGFEQSGQPDQKFRFILPIFLHAGIVHFLLNVYVQLTSSALIERQMGSIRFLLLYVPSGIFGFILGGNFSLVGQPSVGASGAIFSTYAAILVDLIAHWSIEYRPGRKLAFLLFEIISGLLLGLIPGIDNFSHIGGFSMGLLLSIVFFPVLHRTRTHKWTFYGIRILSLVGSIVMFVVLYHNFFKDDPAASCGWCRYLSCWPTASNNRCKGTGLTTTTTVTTTTPSNQSSSMVFMILPVLHKLIMSKFLSKYRNP